MKRRLIVSLLLVVMALPMTGCATLGGGNNNWQNNVPQLKEDVFMFSKVATRVALTEVEMPSEDVELIEGYLVALRDPLAVSGQPDFTGARVLASMKLPKKYQVYGLTIIDVLERYVRTIDFNVTDDQELIISIISAGIDGALEAVQEFAR